MLKLLVPSLKHLPAYKAALKKGWSPSQDHTKKVAKEQLKKIADDPKRFVADLDNKDGRIKTILLSDGSKMPRLPGYYKWIWDGELCGSIDFRWQPGSSKLPVHVLGHIGYSIVPGKRRKGYADRALALMLKEAWEHKLKHVELVTDPANIASQKVILANGGVLVERFPKPDAHGGGIALRYVIKRPRGTC